MNGQSVDGHSASERFKRMRKMFEKKGAVLAEDYEFFTQQMSPLARVKSGIGRRIDARCDTPARN